MRRLIAARSNGYSVFSDEGARQEFAVMPGKPCRTIGRIDRLTGLRIDASRMKTCH